MGLKPGGRASLPPLPLPSAALPSVLTSPPSGSPLPSRSDIGCMEKILVKGDVYTVATKTECTVTSANGTLLGKATAENPVTFTATTDRVELSDPDAEFARVNPKYAPVKLRLLGLLGGGSTNTLPEGYLPAEFIFVNHKDSNVPIFKVSTDTPEAKLEAVVNVQPDYPDVMNFLTSDTHQFGIALVAVHEGKRIRWEYGGIYESVGSLEYNRKYKIKKVGRLNYVDGELIFTNSKTEITTTQYVKIANSHNPCFYLYSLKSDNTKDEKHEYIPALTPDGSPSLYDKVTKTTHVLTFPIGFTLSQARKLDKLPATGGTLTISLPEGYESDEGVANALETARANGWTLTIQTYTPETATAGASTFAFRRIWVRRTQAEQGTYVSADGSRWLVDWCVDMLTPDGSTPDQHGYELFRSQEAAVAYWELEPWVDPEAENLLTNQEQ